ncbi:hypothetical protein M3J09_006032 [Ascochyta lentis]
MPRFSIHSAAALLTSSISIQYTQGINLRFSSFRASNNVARGLGRGRGKGRGKVRVQVVQAEVTIAVTAVALNKPIGLIDNT